MAIKIGNSWVSEAAYAQAKQKTDKNKDGISQLQNLSKKYPDTNFSINTAPFHAKGTNNIAISPNILRQMESNPEKQLEYEALIYDCQSIQKSLSGTCTQSGKKLVAQGFIINSDGTLGSWSISSSNGNNNQFSSMLPKNDKKSWLSKVLDDSSYKREAKRGKTNSYSQLI